MPDLPLYIEIGGAATFGAIITAVVWAVRAAWLAGREVTGIRKDVESNTRSLTTVVERGSQPVRDFMAEFREWRRGVDRRLDGHSHEVTELSRAVKELTATVTTSETKSRERMARIEGKIDRNGGAK